MTQSKFEFDPEHEQIEKITCSSGGRLPYQSEVCLTLPSFLLLFPSLFLTLFSRTSKRDFRRGGIFFVAIFAAAVARRRQNYRERLKRPSLLSPSLLSEAAAQI